jgi:hypothetical protein
VALVHQDRAAKAPSVELSGSISQELSTDMIGRRIADLDFDKLPFEQALLKIEDAAHVKISIPWSNAETDYSSEAELRHAPIRLHAKNLTVGEALNQILPQVSSIHGFDFVASDGVIHICEDPRIWVLPETRIYNIRDIIESGRLGDVTHITATDADLIGETVRLGAGLKREDSNDDMKGPWTMSQVMGLLVVTETPKNLARVEAFLSRLREASKQRAWASKTKPSQ